MSLSYVTLHQQVILPTSSTDAYECFMDERKHASFTASEVQIVDQINTSFSAYDGYITGKNIVLERAKKIVQLWRADEPEWPKHHFSEVVFIFKLHEKGCSIDLYHHEVPAAIAEKITIGWETYYWEPLRFYLER